VRALVLIAAAVALTGGCGGDVTCDAVLQRIEQLSPKRTWAAEPRETLRHRCEQLKLTTRRCIVDATDFAGMMDCYRHER
jgi:hypothetical protein